MTELLDTLEIESFKCFESLRLPLKPLTLLTGFNAAGKSTALQPLLLLAQAARLRAWAVEEKEGKFPLNGEIVRLGSVGDVLRTGATEREILFTLSCGEEKLEIMSSGKAGDRVLGAKVLSPAKRGGPIAQSLNRLVHISAVRVGPADSFPIPDRSYSGLADVGVDGRYACHWYNELSDDVVSKAVVRPESESNTFRRQVDAWLDYLAPGASVNVQSIPAASSLALQFRLSDIGEWKRPANVGYGLTYAFPILVALLAADAGDVVSIDSPEAHLHPKAQSRMGQILATFAAAGVQLMIETHSDHILNGVRLAVAEGIVSSEKVGLTFFAGTSKSGHGVTLPQLDRNGRVDAWPNGFFDQIETDIAKLTEW